ncbi:amidohydrolase family protein [Sorangium sp. So ce321]|uniref:amidohydrolase family protein n=1 Tax=Sorangium sp. So ce321 TaxID=3133300 RepID=UPI003F5DCD2C
MQSSLLIRNGRVLTFSEQGTALSPEITFPRRDILIVGARIHAIAETILPADHPSARVIDAAGHVVSPGFVDTHRHLWKNVMRAFSGNQTLLEYMGYFELDARNRFFEPEDIYHGQLEGACEAIHAGVTTVLDHSHCSISADHARQALRATLRSGLRSVYAYARRPYDEADSARGWQLAEIQRIGGSLAAADDNDGRVTLGMAYDNVKVDAAPLARETLRVARDAGARIITFHYAPVFQGEGLIARAHERGLLDEGFVVSHANHVSEAELAALRSLNAGVAATPETEMQMGHGDPEGFRCLQRGNRVGLGADCQTVCSGDMFSQMRLHLQSARAIRNHALHVDAKDPGKLLRKLELTTDQALRMATLGGAEVLHMEHEIGSLEEGKLADLILVDLRSPNLLGAVDLSQAMVLFASPADVRTVIIHGEVVKDDGRLTRVDWATFARRFEEVQASYLARVEASSTDWEKHYEHVRRHVLRVPDERLV